MVNWSSLREYLPSGMESSSSMFEGREVQIGLGIGGVVLAIFLAKTFLGKKKQYPPGPKGTFFIGNVAQIDPNTPYKTLTSWVAEHGPVYTISMMGQKIVVVSGYEEIYEALVKRSEDFMDRPYNFRALFFTNFNGGLVFGKVNQKWARMKKIVTSSMKMYADGRGKLEDITLDIIQELMDDIKGKKGEPVDLALPLKFAMADIISSIIYSKKLTPNRLQALIDVERPSVEFMTPTGPGSELDVFPFLRYLPTKTYKKINQVASDIWTWFSVERVERKEIRGDEESCVVDALLKAQEQDKVEGNPDPITDEDVTGCTIDLIFAGVATSSSFLQAFIALMVNKPEFQAKIRDEVKKHIGSRKPCLTDREKMPFTEAAIMECLRYMSPTPIPAPHATSKDTTLGGHPIPKDTMMFFNLWHLHHDESFWDAPWEFKPERFLDGSGQLLTPGEGARKRLFAFSAGRRACVGESMAKNRLFLFITSLVQNFKILPDEESGAPDHDPRNYTSGLIIAPKAFNVKMVPV